MSDRATPERQRHGGDWLVRETEPGDVFSPETLGDEHRLIGQMAAEFVTKDVLPYSRTVQPRHTRTYGVNKVGLERRGFTPDQIASIEQAFRFLQRSKLNVSQALEAIRKDVDGPEARILVEFIESSTRGVHK